MMMQPLFADIGDLIGLLVTLAIIGFSVLSKILSSKDPAQGNGNGGAGPRRPPPPRPRQPGQVKRPAAKSIEAEIEDFLREARGEKPRQTPPPQPVPPQPAAAKKRVVEAVPVDRDIVPGHDFGRGLSEHVAEHIGKDSISTRDSHLGDFVEATDERVEQRLERVFDHDVGHLAHAEVVSTEVAEGTDAALWDEQKAESTTAGDILAMLQSPESIRNVFIISEILRRPDLATPAEPEDVFTQKRL